MDRITGNQAKSLMEAYSQVYTKPAAENLNEQAKTTKDGERYTNLPGGGTRKEFQTAEKGGLRVKWVIDKDGKGSWIPDQPEFKPNLQYVGTTGVQTKRIDPTKNDMGEPLKKSEPVREPVREPLRRPKSPPAPAQTFKVGDKQMTKAQINTEYQRLRTSKDPKERESAVQFGKDANKAIFKPATATTAGGTKFERRTPTSAELAAAKKSGGGEAGIKSAVKAGQDARDTAPAGTPLPGVKISPQYQGNDMPGRLGQREGGYTGVPVNKMNNLKTEIDRVRSAISTTTTPTVKSDTDAAANNLKGKNLLNKPKPETQTNSVDLFDILKGEFLEEGYSEEDTMYMMANLNEEQLQEFWKSLGAAALKQANKIPVVKGLVNKVGRMFGRTPAAPTIGSGNIAALRLYQDKAHQSLQRLNQQSTRLNANDARRAAAAADPTRSRLANDPRLVSDRNAREAAAQVRARNRELGRPEWAGPQPVDSLNYKPGDPQFTRSLRQYYADKRAGVKGLPEEFVNENIARLGARLAARAIQGASRISPHVYGKAVKAIRDTGVSRLIPDMNVSPGVVRNTGRGMGIRPIKPAPPKPPLDPAQRYQLLPNTKYGDPVLATPGGRPPVSTPPVSTPTPTPLPTNPMGPRASGTESALNILKRQKMKRNK